MSLRPCQLVLLARRSLAPFSRDHGAQLDKYTVSAHSVPYAQAQASYKHQTLRAATLQQTTKLQVSAFFFSAFVQRQIFLSDLTESVMQHVVL